MIEFFTSIALELPCVFTTSPFSPSRGAPPYSLTSNLLNYNVIYKNISTQEEVRKQVYVINDNKAVIEEQLLKNESDNGPYNFVKSVNASDSFAYAANLKMNDLVGTNSYLYFENGILTAIQQ